MNNSHLGVRRPYGPPFYPVAVDPGGERLGLLPEQRFPKSSKFTQSILTHGRYSNNTLDEATNVRERERRLKERTM